MENLKVVILGVKKYSFTNDQQELVQGCTVHFINEQGSTDEDSRGHLPQKANLPYEYFKTLQHLEFPHWAEALMSIEFGGKTPRLKINGFKPTKKTSIN